MRKGIFLLFWLFIFSQAFAQERLAKPDSVITDSSAARFIVSDILIVGNKITKDKIITRELTFHKGDTLSFNEFQPKFNRSEQNIFNTSLFNSVQVNYVLEKEKVIVYIIVAERWYIFPVPVFEIADRNFNSWWRTKDFSRVVYGGILYWNNFRGRDEEVAFTLRLGYTQRISFYYNIPYINRNQKAGLRIGLSHATNRQIPVRTLNDTVNFFTDRDSYSRTETGGYVAYNYRPDLYKTYSIEAGYKTAEVIDSVIEVNRDYFLPGSKDIRYFSLRYYFKNDHRDIAYYPLNGYYLDAEVSHVGLPFAGDDLNINTIGAHYRKFHPLAKRFFSAYEISGKYTLNNFVPYYLLRGLGYGRDFLRGYEYYVMDGKAFGLLKTNFKFELLPKKQLNLGFIPLNKFSMIPYAFYLNLYADAGYVYNNQFTETNKLVNSLQYSGGAGIDFVTYYDMVFRLEYSINKFGERGFFIHFTSSI
jgi:outer membrane protein assembly factor BamA